VLRQLAQQDVHPAKAGTGLHEICPGPGKWAEQKWERDPLSIFAFPPGTCDSTFDVFPQQHTRNARVLLLGDSTTIRLWGQLCDAWPSGSNKQMCATPFDSP